MTVSTDGAGELTLSGTPGPPGGYPLERGLPSELVGPAGIRNDLCDFLRSWLPVHIGGNRAALGLTPDRLPLPVSAPTDPRKDAYYPREPTAIDRWPLVAVTSGRRIQRGYDTTDDGSVQYLATYQIRVYSWVKAVGFSETEDQRDNFGSAVLTTFLSHLTCGTDGRLQVVPATVVMEFSSMQKVTGDRVVAGSYVGFDLYATETLTDRLAHPLQQPRDTVSGVNAAGTVLPTQSTP